MSCRVLARVIFISLLIVLQFRAAPLLSGSDKKDQVRLARSGLAFEPDATLMNINNISMWVYANGLSGTAPDGESGTVYPRGTGGVVFADGIVWGGRVEDGAAPSLRVGGQTYSTGLVPGSILAPGQGEDFAAPSVNRVWRIRRDYLTADLSRDAAEFHLKDLSEVSVNDIEFVRNKYARDWLDWPWDKGAPFYDAGGDGVYTPEFRADGSPVLYPEADEPGLANADQVVWFVANDLDAQAVQTLYGSPAIGLEVQTTLWAFRQPEALANVIFKRYRLIYKGTATSPATARIDSLHISQWSDPDLGHLFDDYVGVDRDLQVGYAYNANSRDEVFSRHGLPPPAIGYDLLSGFMVSKTSRSEVAIFDLKRRPRSGRLPMTGFSAFGGGGSISDPLLGGDYNSTLQWWNMLRGFMPVPESPQTRWRSRDGRITTFRLAGDPFTRTGSTDSNPGDRRLYFVSGPVNMSLGDSNEVYIGLVGGLGSDRLKSISALRFHSGYAQEILDDLFGLPQSPVLEATELDNEILLLWSTSQSEVERVEKATQGNFSFEGYNIYQLSAPDSDIRSGVKLATFDLKNGTRAILQDEFDPASGALVSSVVQVAGDSGVFRSLSVNRDTLHAEPFYNGQSYHFAVTSYSHNPDLQAPIKWVESLPTVVSVVPQSSVPGFRLDSAMGDTLPVIHNQGSSDGRIVPVVIDPTRLTGDSYRVTFSETADGEISWNLLNASTDSLLLEQMTNLSGIGDFLHTEGFRATVVDVSLAGVSWRTTEESWISLAPSDGQGSPGGLVFGAAYLGNQFIGSGLAGGDFRDVHWDWYPKESFTDLNGNGQYDIGEPYQLTVGDGHQKASMSLTWGAGNYEGFFDVPWAVFDSEADPPRQLHCTVRDRDGNQQWDLDTVHSDPASPDFVNINGGDIRFNYIFVLDSDYDATGASHDPTQGGDDFFATALNGTQNIQWVGWFGQRGSREPLGAGFRLYLEAPNVLTTEDVFTFSTNAPTFDKATARLDVLSQVNVFPNPYLGPFNLSTRFDKGFVTFTHLPPQATARIFTLAGAPVRKLEKMDEGQFLKWDLRNEFERFVGTGIYLAHVEMPELGVSKVLKLMVVPQ